MTTTTDNSLDAEISTLFAHPSPEVVTSIASLVNHQSNVDSILDTIMTQFTHSCFAQPSEIDSCVSSLSTLAVRIDSSLTHPGHSPEDPYATTVLRPAKGPAIVAERLSYTLYRALWGHTSRAHTPDEDIDREHSMKYYTDAFIHGTVLARGFSIHRGFRDQLWREVEDVFVKGLFSGSEQEPAVFIVLSAVLLGASAEIKEYMSQGVWGKGAGWVWYDDERQIADAEWDWLDILEALKTQPGPGISLRLPGQVKTAFDKAKMHVSGGQGSWKSWTSTSLTEVLESFNEY